MASTEKNRKKNLTVSFLTLFLFLGVVFVFSDIRLAHADIGGHNLWIDTGTSNPIDAATNVVGDTIESGFKWLLYGIFVMFGSMASLAVTIFEWAIKPDNVSLLFNSPGVYESWKFVRDFFNLFFILVLLYTAFTLVFQINKDFKKALLSIVLAALFINFSYPVSRVLIDVTNVPMYFFANQMTARDPNDGSGLFGDTMRATQLEKILLDRGKDSDVSRLLMATVFLFLFAVTLLVLAVMFVIRLVALVVLVIFSSVGFAASIIPGLRTYSDMWWNNFWKYAFFGPAAMLMLVVATRLFTSLGDVNSPLMKSMDAVAGATAVGADGATFYASMLMFSVPIIMLWMTMGMAQKFSIAGASSVVGKGQQFSKWAGRKTYSNPLMKGIGGGLKQRTGVDKFQKWMKAPSKTEAFLKGAVVGAGAGGMRAGIQSEMKDIRDKELREKLEEHKKNNPSASSLEEDLRSTDKVKQKAAALRLAETKDVTSPERLQLALSAVADDMSQYAKVLQSADGGAMNLSVAQMTAAVSKKDSAGNTVVNNEALKAVSSRMKKEGQANALVDYQESTGMNRGVAVENMLVEIKSAKDKIKQESLFTDSRNAAAVTRYVTGLTGAIRTELEKTAAQESPAVHAVISTI